MLYALDHIKFSKEMRRKNIKEEAMAELIDVTDRHVRNLKSKDIDVSSSTLYKISRVLEHRMEDLLIPREEEEDG